MEMPIKTNNTVLAYTTVPVYIKWYEHVGSCFLYPRSTYGEAKYLDRSRHIPQWVKELFCAFSLHQDLNFDRSRPKFSNLSIVRSTLQTVWSQRITWTKSSSVCFNIYGTKNVPRPYAWRACLSATCGWPCFRCSIKKVCLFTNI